MNTALYILLEELDELMKVNQHVYPEVIAQREFLHKLVTRLRSIHHTRMMQASGDQLSTRSSMQYAHMQPPILNLYSREAVAGYHMFEVISFNDGNPPDTYPAGAVIEYPKYAELCYASGIRIQLSIDALKRILSVSQSID